MRIHPAMLLALSALASCSKPAEETSGPATVDPHEPVEINDQLVLPRGRPEHLLVITVDTLRRDRVNALGYQDRTTSPTIDTMFTEGVGLMDHRSCSSWTLPSFLCALSGKDQLSLGWWPPNNDGLPPPTPDDLKLMAEFFAEEGFHTILWGASGFLGDSTNSDQGYHTGRALFGDPEQQEQGGIQGPELVEGALEALAARPRDRRLMMHLHFIDPHMPYVASEEWLESMDISELPPTRFDYSTESGTLAAWVEFFAMDPEQQAIELQHMSLRYDAEIRLADEMIARFLASEEYQEIAEDTLVLFYSDHGEEFFEHGNFNHGYNLFEEQLRVPAALWWPGGLEPATVEQTTMHQDLMPTLAAIYELEDPGFSGRVIGSGDPPEAEFTDVYRVDRTHQAVREGEHKLMYRWDGDDLLDGPKYHYDLSVDPLEQNNLYDPESTEVIELWERLLPRVEELAERDPEEDAIPVDPGP